MKDFRLPGCNECHGGGGGMCPALSQGIWFWGNTDDVLFRLATLGSAELEKRGFDRITYGSVHAPMPPMGFAVKTSATFERSSPSSIRSILLEPILPKKWFLQG